MDTWHVYILQCGDNTLYTGVTNDIQKRLDAHTNGSGAKYTRGRGPFTLTYIEEHTSRSEAQKRESQIKRMSRSNKEQLTLSKNNIS